MNLVKFKLNHRVEFSQIKKTLRSFSSLSSFRVLQNPMASSSRVFGNYCRALMAAAKSSAASTTTGTVRHKGILKPLPVSPALGKFLGTSEASRTDAVKKVWDYIKTHNLQNPANKKEINCDDKLKTIFDGKDKVGFLEIARLLSQHFRKAS